jgi:hypothetical protein
VIQRVLGLGQALRLALVLATTMTVAALVVVVRVGIVAVVVVPLAIVVVGDFGLVVVALAVLAAALAVGAELEAIAVVIVAPRATDDVLCRLGDRVEGLRRAPARVGGVVGKDVDAAVDDRLDSARRAGTIRSGIVEGFVELVLSLVEALLADGIGVLLRLGDALELLLQLLARRLLFVGGALLLRRRAVFVLRECRLRLDQKEQTGEYGERADHVDILHRDHFCCVDMVNFIAVDDLVDFH